MMQSKPINAQEPSWQTIAIGVVLIATGSILLGGDYLGFLSLDNVQKFWPIALAAIGMMDLRSSSGRQQG